mmetsp:Transcript_114563/g.286329  ORF Transcript_114563/g.286329 Transcript_114563/m.286329 type:complete len:281 (-) Transcript_114563:448-1290(-)
MASLGKDTAMYAVPQHATPPSLTYDTSSKSLVEIDLGGGDRTMQMPATRPCTRTSMRSTAEEVASHHLSRSKSRPVEAHKAPSTAMSGLARILCCTCCGVLAAKQPIRDHSMAVILVNITCRVSALWYPGSVLARSAVKMRLNMSSLCSITSCSLLRSLNELLTSLQAAWPPAQTNARSRPKASFPRTHMRKRRSRNSALVSVRLSVQLGLFLCFCPSPSRVGVTQASNTCAQASMRTSTLQPHFLNKLMCSNHVDAASLHTADFPKCQSDTARSRASHW